MTKSRFIPRCLLLFVVFVLVGPFNSNASCIAPCNHPNEIYSLKKPAPRKLSPGKRILLKVSKVLIKSKKPSNTALIIAAVLACLLVAFVAFSLAYAGAAAGVPLLVLVLGVGLIIFGAIKLSKKRKQRS